MSNFATKYDQFFRNTFGRWAGRFKFGWPAIILLPIFNYFQKYQEGGYYSNGAVVLIILLVAAACFGSASIGAKK